MIDMISINYIFVNKCNTFATFIIRMHQFCLYWSVFTYCIGITSKMLHTACGLRLTR